MFFMACKHVPLRLTLCLVSVPVTIVNKLLEGPEAHAGELRPGSPLPFSCCAKTCPPCMFCIRTIYLLPTGCLQSQRRRRGAEGYPMQPT